MGGFDSGNVVVVDVRHGQSEGPCWGSVWRALIGRRKNLDPKKRVLFVKPHFGNGASPRPHCSISLPHVRNRSQLIRSIDCLRQPSDRRLSPPTYLATPIPRHHELRHPPRSFDPHSPQGRLSQGPWCGPQRRSHAARRQLLREAPPWPGSRDQGHWHSRPLRRQALQRQERLGEAHYPRPRLSPCYRLRPELLLPPPPPQEQCSLSDSQSVVVQPQAV